MTQDFLMGSHQSSPAESMQRTFWNKGGNSLPRTWFSLRTVLRLALVWFQIYRQLPFWGMKIHFLFIFRISPARSLVVSNIVMSSGLGNHWRLVDSRSHIKPPRFGLFGFCVCVFFNLAFILFKIFA